MNDLEQSNVERLIKQKLGERCEDFDTNCLTCVTWWLFDRVEDHEYDHFRISVKEAR